MTHTIHTLFASQTRPITFSSGKPENIVLADRTDSGFSKAAAVLLQAGIQSVGVIGWGSQAPAQAQNLRDSLLATSSGIKVRVGLRPDSSSIRSARDAGFTTENDALGETLAVINKSDLVLLLIADGALVNEHQRMFAALKPGATIGFSHGFLNAHLESVGQKFPPNHNVVLMAPKGMGRTVRERYLQSSGINSSVGSITRRTMEIDPVNIALSWANLTGSPTTFFTTLPQELTSDLTGERGVLLGGLWALSEVLYEKFAPTATTPRAAFLSTAKALVSIITDVFVEKGLLGFYQSLDDRDKAIFRSGFLKVYQDFKIVVQQIYAAVASLDEVREVVERTSRLDTEPMESIESTTMWADARTSDYYSDTSVWDRTAVFSAGAYAAAILAQVDVLLGRGHRVSEVVNESIIEALLSLNPIFNAKGLGFMVDNCSITARLGTRKWGPVFKERLAARFASQMHPADATFDTFQSHTIHNDLATLMQYA